MEINEKLIDSVWNLGEVIFGVNPSMFRKDYAGAMIMRSAYGRRDISMGWEIDHLIPRSKGGTDDIDNLMPIQWENNLKKSDNFPIWQSCVTFRDRSNIYVNNTWLAIKSINGVSLLKSK